MGRTEKMICSVDEVKAYSKIVYSDLGYIGEASFNTFLESLIPLAASLIEGYCNVPSGFFNAGGKTFTGQVYDYRYPWIDLYYYPVLSVSKVEINNSGYGTAPSWETLNSQDYILASDNGQLMLVNKVPAIVEQSVKVTYTAGYTATPDLIKHVCLQICSNVLHGILQRKISPTVQVGDFTFKVLTPEVFTRELQLMLQPYIRKTVNTA
jgi:hypothetical protein